MELVMYIIAAVGVVALYCANCIVLEGSYLLRHERSKKARLYTYVQVAALYGLYLFCLKW